MKSILCRIVLILLPVALLLQEANAYDAKINGIYYNFSGSVATVTYKKKFEKSYSGAVVIPKTVTDYGKTYSVKYIGEMAFFDCDGLTSVVIPNSVTSIGNEAFNYCHGLTSVTIPNSVTSIGNWAFNGCSLTSVTIPNSVTSIGNDAFSGCSLNSIGVETGNTTYDSRNNCNAIIETATNTLILGCDNTVIPCNVANIGKRAFSWCNLMTSITIPNSVTTISNEAFEYCKGLTSITIPNSVTNIESSAFEGCSGLTSVTIPNSVISIEDGVFSGCYGLTSIKVEIENTKYDSRNNCNAIIETASNTLITGCKNTIIPNSVTAIGNSAFLGNRDLISITIPNSVTTIGNYTFKGCSSLTDVYCYAASVPGTGSSVFYDSPISSATLHVPAFSVEDYRATVPWSSFGTITAIIETTDISVMDNVIYIEPVEARAGNPKILSVKMKNSVPIESFGFDLILPEGFSVATDEDGFALAELSTERTTIKKTNHFDAQIKSDGSLNVQAYSSNGYAISGNDGEIALLTINVSSGLEAGCYPIILRNIAMGDASATSYRVEYITSVLTILYILGDANGDGYVDVADLTAISHKILNRPDASFNTSCADANGDGFIDVGDLTAVSHIILWGSVLPPNAAMRPKRVKQIIEPR